MFYPAKRVRCLLPRKYTQHCVCPSCRCRPSLDSSALPPKPREEEARCTHISCCKLSVEGQSNREFSAFRTTHILGVWDQQRHLNTAFRQRSAMHCYITMKIIAHVVDLLSQYLLATITNVATALVEGHHCLHLQTVIPHHINQLPICRPIVLMRTILLNDPPPDIHHNPLHASRF